MTAITEPKQEEVLFFPLKPPYVTRPSWLLIQPGSRDQSLWVQLGLSRLLALDSSQDASSQREKVKEGLINIWRESRRSGGFKTHNLTELCRITRSQIRGLQLDLVGTPVEGSVQRYITRAQFDHQGAGRSVPAQQAGS